MIFTPHQSLSIPNSSFPSIQLHILFLYLNFSQLNTQSIFLFLLPSRNPTKKTPVSPVSNKPPQLFSSNSRFHAFLEALQRANGFIAKNNNIKMTAMVVQSSSPSSIQCGSPTPNDELRQNLHLANSRFEPLESDTQQQQQQQQQEEQERDRNCRRDKEEEEDQLSVLALFVTAFRNSLVRCYNKVEEGSVSSSWAKKMEIGLPTNVRHVAHVTFDRFSGFLGLPVEFEPEVPTRAPSASTTVFGVSTNSMQLSFDSRGNSVPSILLRMQRRLYALRGLEVEGIFRINAGNDQEEYVRDQLNRGVVPDDADVHCLAGLIKTELWRVVNAKAVTVRREMRSVIRAEMFGQLTSGFEAAWSKLKGQEVLTKENIAEPMRDIRRALLEADVSLPVVKRFVESVSDQAVGTELIKGVQPDQQLVKIVRDELVKLMGGEVSELVFAKSGPTVILLAGLQGVGKTTVCAKLAFYLKKLGKSCMLVAGDVFRPAAIDQLAILGKQVDVPVYTAGTDVKPSVIAKQGLEEAKKKKIDVVIMDTAGRLQIDKTMMDELKEVKQAIKPTEVLLVVDAMTGQEAATLVSTFDVEIGITGAILTKLDGDSRGGAALTVKEVSGKPIKLVGRGERMEDLEPFYPDRMAGRILGMGDALSFVEKAQEVMEKEEAEELQNKIKSAKFDFNDFLKQTRTVARMGSMSRVLGMIPGMGKITPAQIREAEKSLKLMESMIEVMTPEEREKPELLAESPVRRKRVAKDSGKTEQQVSQLIAQLYEMRARMKNLMGLMEGGSLPAISDIQEAMKPEQKPPGTAKRKRKSASRRQFADSSTSRPSPRGFGSGN